MTSKAYEKARLVANQASRDYTAAADAWQAGEMDEPTFDRAQRAWEASQAVFDEAFAAEQERPQQTETELTEAGEQFVVPGAERRHGRKQGEQFDLFGG